MDGKQFSLEKQRLVTQFGEALLNGAKPPEYLKALKPLIKFAKVREDRLTSAIIGAWMEANPATPSKTKPSDIYAVFQDEQRHTCIRVGASPRGVSFIPMDTVLDVKKLSNIEFEKQYIIHLQDYPVKQAASLYLGASWLGVTEAAQKHLEYLAGKKFTDPTKPLNFENKEYIMATTKKPAAKKASAKDDAATPALKFAKEKVAAQKTAAPAKKEKVTAKADKKPAAKAAPAKKEKAETSGKRTTYAGMKIKVLNKDHGRREGSWTAAMLNAILGSKTTDDAQANIDANKDFAGRKVDFGWAVAQGYVEIA